MSFYLPIAEMSANGLLFALVGAAVGFLSGMFGVGGGFLITPLMIFLGIPPAVAVGSSTAPVIATSVSGAVTQYRRGNVDIKMGNILLTSGIVGSGLGALTVNWLRRVGQFEFVVSIVYVVFLGTIGALMLIESAGAMSKAKRPKSASPRKTTHHSFLHGLPFKMRFIRSKLYTSAIPPVMIGSGVGFLSAIIGVGGGVVMVPAMIYLLRMPTNVVIGTSLYQIVFVAAATTILQAALNHTVDVVLAVMLMLSGVVGSHFGGIIGQRLRGEELRFYLAVLVLLVCIRIAWDLIAPPFDPYSIGKLG